MVTVYVDGSINGHVEKENVECHGGWYALDNNGELIRHESFSMGTNPAFSATSAEYAAIEAAMSWLADNWEIDYLTIKSDSQVAVRQLNNIYQCHSADLRPRLEACEKLEVYFVNVNYEWIPRESNKIADVLSKALQFKHGGIGLTHEQVQAMLNEGEQ